MSTFTGNFNVGAKPVGILARALTGNIFVEQNLAYMNEGDKDGYNVYKHDIQNTLVAWSADPAAAATSTDQAADYKRELTILQSFEQFNPYDYHQYWREFQPAGPFQWEGLPAEVQSNLEELFLGTVAEAVEGALTAGDAIFTDGLVPQLLSSNYTTLDGAVADADAVVNNTAIAYRVASDNGNAAESEALTSANIFTKLELLIANQTKAMRKRPNRKFMMSHGTADLIREAQRLELNFKGVDVTEAGIMRYAGYDMIENPSFPDDTLLFCSMSGDMKTDAIQLGTSQSSDFNNLEVERLSNFGRYWGMSLTFAIDISVVRPEEICFYSTAALDS